ncbi:hypothetical protein Q1695_016058 [Nippostrongylus brasiliensis]|nr:hypothetical protein Q1695_016058 [Nippostrongylus brasiliensis]
MSDATTTHDDDDRAMIKGISAAVNETVTLGKQTTISERPKSGEGAETSAATFQSSQSKQPPAIRTHASVTIESS